MGRLRGFLWLVSGLVVAGLAGIVAFVTLTRAAAQGTGEVVSRPGVPVVVASRRVTLGSTLTSADLEVIEFPIDIVPEGAMGEQAEAVGQVALVGLAPGEVVLARRLMDPNVTSGDGRLALFVAEDEVLMAFPATDLMTSVGVLKPGDRVDLFISLVFPANRGMETATSEGEAVGPVQREELATFVVLQNVGIAALIGGPSSEGESGGFLSSGGGELGSPEAILLTLSPQDALVLKYVKDAGGIQDIVLRAPGAERPFSTDPVDVDYVINRYQIPTEPGR